MRLVQDRDSGLEDSGANVEPLLRDLRSMSDHAGRVQDEFVGLATDFQSARDNLERYVSDRVRGQPYRTLGAAAGIGYLLGGGLRSPLTAMLLGAAARLVAAQALREFVGVAEQGPARAVHPTRNAVPTGESDS